MCLKEGGGEHDAAAGARGDHSSEVMAKVEGAASVSSLQLGKKGAQCYSTPP